MYQKHNETPNQLSSQRNLDNFGYTSKLLLYFNIWEKPMQVSRYLWQIRNIRTKKAVARHPLCTRKCNPQNQEYFHTLGKPMRMPPEQILLSAQIFFSQRSQKGQNICNTILSTTHTQVYKTVDTTSWSMVWKASDRSNNTSIIILQILTKTKRFQHQVMFFSKCWTNLFNATC